MVGPTLYGLVPTLSDSFFFLGGSFSRKIFGWRGVCNNQGLLASLASPSMASNYPWGAFGGFGHLPFVLYFWSQSIFYAFRRILFAWDCIQHSIHFILPADEPQSIQRTPLSHCHQYFTFSFSTHRTKNRRKSDGANLSAGRFSMCVCFDHCSGICLMAKQGGFKLVRTQHSAPEDHRDNAPDARDCRFAACITLRARTFLLPSATMPVGQVRERKPVGGFSSPNTLPKR